MTFLCKKIQNRQIWENNSFTITSTFFNKNTEIYVDPYFHFPNKFMKNPTA